MEEKMSQEEMVKEAVEEAKAKAAKEAEESGKAAEGTESDKEQPETEHTDTGDAEDKEESDTEKNEPEADEAETEEEVGSEEKPKGKGFFGKKNKKDKKDEKIEELTDKLTRQMAEFDNFRKRTDKEKSQMYEIGAKDVIEKILPVVDNFARGLAAVSEDEQKHPFMEGMDKVYKHLMTTLEEIGVKPIEAVGAEFNPDFHNAVMHVEDEELGENIVAEEFQKGYMYRDHVVRHSMVKVAN